MPPNEIKESLQESQAGYELRTIYGEQGWSASTKCKICGDWWLWGVKDNLDFTCPKCTV